MTCLFCSRADCPWPGGGTCIGLPRPEFSDPARDALVANLYGAGVSVPSTLICCLPRSGAAWLTAFLRRLKLPATHEVLFRPEAPRPNVPPNWIETSWLATPFVHDTRADQKFHLVRNPLHVVRSILRIKLFDRELDPYVFFAREHVLGWQDRDPLGNACEMVRVWHAALTELPTIRIENLLRYPPNCCDLVSRLGSGATQREISIALSEMPDRVNQRGDSSADTVGWGDLTPEVVRIAEGLGYL